MDPVLLPLSAAQKKGDLSLEEALVESRYVTAWRQIGHRQGAAPEAWFHTLRMHSAANGRPEKETEGV